jgi:hypothetical protein
MDAPGSPPPELTGRSVEASGTPAKRYLTGAMRIPPDDDIHGLGVNASGSIE